MPVYFNGYFCSFKKFLHFYTFKMIFSFFIIFVYLYKMYIIVRSVLYYFHQPFAKFEKKIEKMSKYVLVGN